MSYTHTTTALQLHATHTTHTGASFSCSAARYKQVSAACIPKRYHCPVLYTMSEKKADPDPSYTREDLSFVKEPPEEISIECPICLQIMLKDISQTSCGHHFCTSCIKKIRKSCPTCRATSYRIFPDADRQHYISGRQVYCSNKKYGCTWEGELKNLSGHSNKEEREGGCQFEVVKCRYWDGGWPLLGCCDVEMKRADLANHEEKKCPKRPYTCQYCGDKDTYWNITNYHYCECPKYPVHCLNKCDPKKTMPREEVKAHKKNDCPLEPVACELCWAGCTARPQRKDIEQHITSNQIQHLTLLAKACKELSKTCAELKKENAELKEESKKSNLEIKKLKGIISRNGLQ